MSEHGHDHEARLSDYLDGELGRSDVEAVEAHLAECSRCRDVLEGLAGVRARARALEDRAPRRDLWPAIREALARPTVIDLSEHRDAGIPKGGGSVRRGVFLSLPQLGATAAALVVLAAGGAWGVARTVGPDAGAPGEGAAAALDAGTLPTGPEGLGLTADPGDAAPRFTRHAEEVARLQDVLRRGRERLDPNTVRILEKNLALIDGAIRESMEALAVDPGNPFVEEHLQRSFERKVTYLREAVTLLDRAD